MTIVDGLIIAAFVVYAVVTGLRSRREASRNLEEYFLAGRTLRGWQAGLSMAATQFAADTPLLVTGLVATAGIFSLWRLWIYALAFLLMGFVLASSWRRARILTDAELTELRYGGRAAAPLRAIKAIWFGTVINCTVLAMVLFAAKEITEPFLPWDAWLPAVVHDAVRTLVETVGAPFARPGPELWIRSTNNLISIGAIAAVTLLYSTTGGLRSVVRTDVVQFALMMIGMALYAWWIAAEAGGLSAIPEKIHALFPAGDTGRIGADEILAFTPSRARDAGLVVLAVFALQWIVQMNADGTGYLAQRSMACRTDRDAREAAVVFTVAQILVRSLLWLPIALGLLVIFPPDPSVAGEALRAEREATFVRGMNEILPPGLTGILFTAMLAALASTLDTHLNWGASYWTNDLYARFFCRGLLGRTPSDRSLVWVARLSNLLVLAIALGVMTQLSSIQTAWHLSLLFGAGMGVLLVLRWLWWRINAWGEIAALGASMILAPALLLTLPGDAEALRLLLMAAGSTLAGVTASLVAGPDSEATLDGFYARARPPGFWGPVAGRIDGNPLEARLRLGRGLLAMTLAAFSIFCLLTGFGSWIAASPPPVWVPWRSAWIAVLLVTGTLLVPLWWRLGFAEPAGTKPHPGG